MKLIDMKRQSETEDSTMLSPKMQDEYPWGLRLSLDDETLTKLGMGGLPKIDAEYKLVALACVVSISQNESAEGAPRRHVELQIEQMVLAPAAEEEDEGKAMAKGMYPSMIG